MRPTRPHSIALVELAEDGVTVGFTALLVFQGTLAAGAPLGHAAWGGASADLSTGQRVGSLLSVAFYGGAIVVVRRRATGRAERRYRWGTWVLVAVMGISALANEASGSPWETYLMAPVALALAGLCAVVARSATGLPAGEQSRHETTRPLVSR